MIYVLVGNDREKKKSFIKKSLGGDITLVFDNDFTKESILNEALSFSLFEDKNSFIFDNVISDKKIDFNDKELKILKESLKIFIFREDKFTALNEKKYKKFAQIENFDKSLSKDKENDNFTISLYFGNNDKLKTWMAYRKAIESGAEPEAISGILFWKIKNIMMTGNKFFSKEKIKKMSSELVSIYHDSHKGIKDMTISLEKFILSSLGK